MKKLGLIFLLVSIFTQAQNDTINIKITPGGRYDKLYMYHLEGVNQNYFANAEIQGDEFNMVIYRDADPKGVYRVYYDLQNKEYFDLIYNGEPISVTYDTTKKKNAMTVNKSDENKIYQDYITHILKQEFVVDSIQYAYFNPNNKTKKVRAAYKAEEEKLMDMQHKYEAQAEGMLAYHFINSHQKYKSPTVVEDPSEYMSLIKSHFFEHVDFHDTALYNSTFLIDQVAIYVFNICRSNDPNEDYEAKRAAIDHVMHETEDHLKIRADILTSLIYAFAGEQDIRHTNYLIENYYKKLPAPYQDDEFVQKIVSVLKTAIGANAPDFDLGENNGNKKLSELEGADHYLVVFWSTSCSHCLIEIPKLYDMTKDMKSLKVIAIALETNEGPFDREISKYSKWINVYGEGKWDNAIGDSYNVDHTPNFFLLDKDKYIQAKPQNVEQLKSFFKTYHENNTK